jgi:hypothetical protein
LIFKATISVYCFEGSDPHDEIIDKLVWNFDEATILIVFPLLIDNEIFIRTLHIISIEDNLAEVHIRDQDLYL